MREKEGKNYGKIYWAHTSSYSPKLLSTKSLPTALNDHRHRSNHLLMSPKTYLLWLHNEMLFFKFSKYARIRCELNSLIYLGLTQQSLISCLLLNLWKSRNPNFTDMKNLMLLFIIES